MIDHSKCLQKVRKEHSDKSTEYIRFDLHTIRTIDNKGNILANNKSAQQVWVKETNKKREIKSFIAHYYCPWCGKKY